MVFEVTIAHTRDILSVHRTYNEAVAEIIRNMNSDKKEWGTPLHYQIIHSTNSGSEPIYDSKYGVIGDEPKKRKSAKKKSVSPLAEVDRAFAESKKQIKL